LLADSVQTSTTTFSPTFEPTLNLPAFSVFLLIVTIFTLLQIRVRAIEDAIQRRTQALQELRVMKTKSLTAVGDDAIDAQTMQDAIDTYRQRYEEVETLREIIPGIARIIPPPSQSNPRRTMEENEQAAYQFLGIVPQTNDKINNSNAVHDPSTTNKPTPTGFTTLQKVLLAFIIVSQCSLFLLLSLDPMASINMFDMIDTVTGME
jgi:hypothetical protein